MRPVATRLLALALSVPAAALADQAVVMNHHGHLRDGTDRPVDRSQLALTFRIFDQELPVGSQQKLWEGACRVNVVGGYYAAVLGTDTCGPNLLASHVAAGQQRFLEVEVDGAKLSPRLRISAVPFATHALDAERVGGRTLAELDSRYARFDASSAQAGSLGVAGRITAGSFEGDGAGLRNVPSSALTGTLPDAVLPADVVRSGAAGGDVTLPGKVSASSFAGDGAAITNLAWSNVQGIPLALLDGDDGLTEVKTGAGLAGKGTTGAPLAIAPGGIASSHLAPNVIGSGQLATGAVGSAQLAADLSSISKISGGAIASNGTSVGIGTAPAAGAKLSIGGLLQLKPDTTTACDATTSGSLRWTGAALQLCANNAWTPLAMSIGTQANPGRSCKAILEAGAALGDGSYWIDPDGPGAGAAFPVYCDIRPVATENVA